MSNREYTESLAAVGSALANTGEAILTLWDKTGNAIDATVNSLSYLCGNVAVPVVKVVHKFGLAPALWLARSGVPLIGNTAAGVYVVGQEGLIKFQDYLEDLQSKSNIERQFKGKPMEVKKSLREFRKWLKKEKKKKTSRYIQNETRKKTFTTLKAPDSKGKMTKDRTIPAVIGSETTNFIQKGVHNKRMHLQKRILNENELKFLVYMCNKNPYIKEDCRFIEACVRNPKKMNTLMESTGMVNERALELMRLASKLEEAGLGGLIKNYFAKNPDTQHRYQGADNANYRAAMNADNMDQLQHYLPMLTKQERRAVIGNFMKKQALAGKAAVGRGLDSAGAAVKSKIRAGADAVNTFTDRLGELPGKLYRKAGVEMGRVGNLMAQGKAPYHPVLAAKGLAGKVGNALSGRDVADWTPKGSIPVVAGTIPSFNKFKKNFAESIDAYSHVISPRNLYSLYVLECAANIYGVKKLSKKHKKS